MLLHIGLDPFSRRSYVETGHTNDDHTPEVRLRRKKTKGAIVKGEETCNIVTRDGNHRTNLATITPLFASIGVAYM